MSTLINATAVVKDIQMDQGKTLELPFTVKRNNSAFDCTDYTLRAQFRRTYASDAVVNCTTANGKLVWTNQAVGEFKLVLAETDTSTAGNPKVSFKADETSIDLVYDIEMANLTTGVVYGLVKGTLTVNREATR